jgi:hypothetical protein
MGRSKKIIANENGIDKRDSGYYSTPSFIAKYITEELLKLNPTGERVLDPAVGNEELLKTFFEAGKEIDSFDVIEHGKKKYSNFKKQDFIEFYKNKKSELFFSEHINLNYDYYIANPPYNCHEIDYIRTNKQILTSLFKETGVLNMYSMFLSALISCAKQGALIGVILSDSFLTATMHSGLRQQILENCTIHQLILCPNDLFASQKADVRTCIIILQKGLNYQKKVVTSNRPKNTADLKYILENRKFQEIDISSLVLSNKKNNNQFIIDVEPEVLELFNSPNIGDTFDCITGISTGNDNKYLSKIKKNGFEIPFYKNPGRQKFKAIPDAYLINSFLEESLHVKDFMVRNKKFLFREGITCSSMGLPFSACYLPSKSTFGVNPNIFPPSEDLYWLISYLNSHLVTYLVRGILIRSNMVTSGYVSNIPIINFSQKEKQFLSEISKDVIGANSSSNEAVKLINNIVYSKMDFNSNVRAKIDDFAINLYKRV